MDDKFYNITKKINEFTTEIYKLNSAKSVSINDIERIQIRIDQYNLEITKLNDIKNKIVEEENLKESNLNHERIKQNKILSLRVQLYALSNARDENKYFQQLVNKNLQIQKCCEECCGWNPSNNNKCGCGTEWHFEMNEQTGKLYPKKC